jgi:hypothetical protein
MRCGDTSQAGLKRFCPRCESRKSQRYQWKPDQAPESHKRRCYVCGWDSGWVEYDEWIVLRGGPPITDFGSAAASEEVSTDARQPESGSSVKEAERPARLVLVADYTGDEPEWSERWEKAA